MKFAVGDRVRLGSFSPEGVPSGSEGVVVEQRPGLFYPYSVQFGTQSYATLIKEDEIEAVEPEFKEGDRVRVVTTYRGDDYTETDLDGQLAEYVRFDSKDEIFAHLAHFVRVDGETTWVTEVEKVVAEAVEPEETVSKKALVEALEEWYGEPLVPNGALIRSFARHGIDLSEPKKTKRVRVEFDVEGEVVYDDLPQYWDGQPIKNVTVEVLDD